MKQYQDDAALLAVAAHGGALCTVVGIEGGFSRRVGAQLAVLEDGALVGSLADDCLEKQLASDVAKLTEPAVHRYGAGSPFIDFRLPCGGGIDILLDPSPDAQACAGVAADLRARCASALPLPTNALMERRQYIPPLALDVIGNGPEVECLAALASAMELPVRVVRKGDLSLGQRPGHPVPDRWTATILLFHDHEWEGPILAHALSGDGFYIGAQGGHKARLGRVQRLRELGVAETDIARVRGPVGAIPSCREPDMLAVSILAEIMAEYEKLRDA